MAQLTVEQEKNIRSKWVVGDWVEVFDKSRDKWFRAKIIEIYNDENGEWLGVVVENTMIKEVQRFTPDVRPCIGDSDDDSDDDDSDDDDSDSDYSDSDYSESDDEHHKHHELFMIVVECAGTAKFNGKYVYSTTTFNGYPIFEHIDNKHLLIQQNEDDMRWEFVDKRSNVFYYADSDKEFPPTKGWTETKVADLPNPVITLEQFNTEEASDEFAPFFMMKYTFENVKSEPLGFDLQILQLHSQFVAVHHIKPESLAETFGILPGDILVSANNVDLSKIKDIEGVSSCIERLIKSQGKDGKITITFARQKKTFKSLICRRGGSKVVNGRYGIQGMENDALMFAKNDNPNFKFQRVYVNEEEDEAIWALREYIIIHNKDHNKKIKRESDNSDESDSDESNHRDYYIVLAKATDEVPPERAWEAVHPYGEWPSVGLQYYDIDVVPPSKPTITRTQINPNAVQIHFECDEKERKPRLVPHMECWYEIEVKHYKPHVSKLCSDTKIWKCQSSPFVANRLINGDEYEFTVRSCNHIASTNSDISQRVCPLQLPPKAKIIDITGKPGELYIHFHCNKYNDPQVQAGFEIIIDPPIDEECQDYPIKNHRLLVDNDRKPIRLRNLINGTKYQIIVASVNSVGVTYSETESAYPSKEPPQPDLDRVIAGNREMIVFIKCPGFDKPDTRAWFEMELDPPPPSTDKADEKEPQSHKKADEKERTKLERKSRWRRQTVKQKLFDVVQIAPPIGDSTSAHPNEYNDDFIPYFRRNARHYGSPVKISPLVNGIPYIVRVKAVTLSGSKVSAFSEWVLPKGPPPIPKITKLTPLESSVMIEFACEDYATEEYKAMFETESTPNTITMKSIRTSPYVFPKLNNGWSYTFRVRAVNKEGKSKWSQMLAPVTPLNILPQPIELRCVPFNKEITVFWVGCVEVKSPEYSGWYEVESEPPTFTMIVTRQQARFRRLTNGIKYTFKVTAVNSVTKGTSICSKPCIPDDDISKQSYERQRKRIACELREVYLKIAKQRKKQRAHEHIQVHRRKALKQRKPEETKKKKTEEMMRKRARERKKALQESKKKKEEKARLARKLKMQEQRSRVLSNRRRMSALALGDKPNKRKISPSNIYKPKNRRKKAEKQQTSSSAKTLKSDKIKKPQKKGAGPNEERKDLKKTENTWKTKKMSKRDTKQKTPNIKIKKLNKQKKKAEKQQSINKQMIDDEKQLQSLNIDDTKQETVGKSEDEHPLRRDIILPLHRFTPKNLCYHIKQWIINDSNYKSHLSKTQDIFAQYQLSGKAVATMSTDNIKRIVERDLLKFMTNETLDIMFNSYHKWNGESSRSVASKSAKQLADVLFNYPLNNLLKRINDEKIDGKQFIQSVYNNDVDLIANESGWKQNEVHQIQSILFRHHTFSELKFKEHMGYVMSKQYAQCISKEALDKIKDAILEFNVEEIHYKIKNARDIEEFSHCVLNLVDELRQNDTENEDDFVQRIYKVIAECFIFDGEDLCSKLQQWICNNCGNRNFNAVIDSTPTTKIEVCSLCGIREQEQIILKIKSQNTYISVTMFDGVPDSNVTNDDGKVDDIDSLIQSALEGHEAFNLFCPNQNNNDNCKSMLRLAHMLIKYKRWLHTIYKKTNGKDDIERTIKVNVAKYIDNDTFKHVFLDSIKAIELINTNKMKFIAAFLNDNFQVLSEMNSLLKRNKTMFSNMLQQHMHTSILFGCKLYTAISKELKQNSKESVDDNTFKRMFIENAESIQRQTSLLTKMFKENVDNIGDIAFFLDIKRLEFTKCIRKHTNIDIATGGKLYTKINDSLKKKAQTKQFGKFLTDLDVNKFMKDYQHILKIHIKQGNKISIENAFRFFQKAVHYEDKESEKLKCRSLKRREERINGLNSDNKEDVDIAKTAHNYHQGTDIWSLKQYYTQSQLDIVHSYLVHSNWQRAVQRYSNKDSNTGDEDEYYDEELKSDEDFAQNKGKYTTDLSEADTAEYGFGIDHSHPHLKPKYDSIHDELLLNKLHRLTKDHFQCVLIKSINFHKIALKNYDELRCKYYQPQFNIIRNDPIGLRHVFSIIVYTDISAFCTAFRQTFRRLSNESSEKVTHRHQQLYYYAKSLYEAVEFFGEYMDSKLQVYHGLNRVLHFAKFTAYFNQPISTTTELSVANQFSAGIGIILSLKAATEYLNDPTKKVKYLSVSWLSSFPNEDEKMFYGKYVVFKICNIYHIDQEDNKLKGHSAELILLNKFQKTVQNEEVQWNDDKHLKAMIMMIKQRQNIKTAPSESYVTEFGKSLFNHFCDSVNKICIKNFKSLPDLLRAALLGKDKISLLPITRLFNKAKEIILNELDIEQMTVDAQSVHVQAVLDYIRNSQKTPANKLEKIIFKSKQQNDGKENSVLKKLANKYSRHCSKYQWEMYYELSDENTHNLTFLTHKTATVTNDLTRKRQHKIAHNAIQGTYSNQQQQIPTFFMQMTSADEDVFHINVMADQISNKTKKVFIKEFNKNNSSTEFKRVKIEKGQLSAGIDIEINDKHNERYSFALFENKKEVRPIPNSVQLEVIVLKDEDEMPPNNSNYKPQTIDLSTVFQVKDIENNKVNIYWSTPPRSFGDISYKIIKNDNIKNEEIISLLPYSVPLSLVSTVRSFTVVTTTDVDGDIYESNRSDPVIVKYSAGS